MYLKELLVKDSIIKNIEGMIELNGKEFEIIKKCKSKKTIY
jgi:hypothetical protein